jgi:glucose/arabinose dehydrogenase
MDDYNRVYRKVRALSQFDHTTRNSKISDFNLPPEYNIEVFAFGLDAPVAMAFSTTGDIFIADSGINSGISKIIRLSNGRFDIIDQNFNTPITGLSYLNGDLYVSHKGFITVLHPNGIRQDIIAGLPCNGDFALSNIAFGPDGKMYFGLGTATNSGVVGSDNLWITSHPLLADTPATNIIVNGQNFVTNNTFTSLKEKAYTGAFSPYGVPNEPNEVKKGCVKASGSILRANKDGTELELVAWGFRNPIHLEFNRNNQLFVSNRGYDVRGSRPIANAPDEFYQVIPGIWYGWPDYSAGEPVTLPKFQPEGGKQPEFLLANHPNIPPAPLAKLSPHSSITGFDFNYNSSFGNYGDVYITEFGSYGPITVGQSAPYEGIGHRISRIDINTGGISTFIGNKSGLPVSVTGEGGFGRPVDIKFGPDGAMYILDFGISNPRQLNQFVANTGIIWRIYRKK